MKPFAKTQVRRHSARGRICYGMMLPSVLFATLTAAGQAQKPGSFVITGTLLGQDGSAVHGGEVSVEADRPCSDKGNAEKAEADAGGHFELRLPCPGVWRLSAEAPGFPKQMYHQHGSFSTGILLSPSDREYEASFRMAGSSSVTGTVLDEAGDPVRDAKVFLLMPGASGEEASRTVDQATTDDRGMYEFSHVSPGDYEVAVQAQPWYAVAANSPRSGGTAVRVGENGPPIDPSLDVTYPLTFYPAAMDASSASTIEVAGGATQQADVHLSPVPSVHVVVPTGGRMNISGGGRPMSRGGAATPMIEQVSDFGALRFEPTSVTMLPDGSLDVGGFSAGDYSIANSRSRDDAGAKAFRVAKDSGRTIMLGDAAVKAEPKSVATGTLSGTAMLAQKPCEGAMLLLVPISGGKPQRQQSNTDGSFRFEKVPLGRYILLAVDQGWRLDLRDRQTLSGLLTRGLPVDLEGTMALKTPVEAQSR